MYHKLIKIFYSKIYLFFNLLSLTTIMLSSGCATMFNGTDQSVYVSTDGISQSEKVRVKVNDGYHEFNATIPSQITLLHSMKGVAITVKDKKYDSTTYTVKKSIAMSTFLNLLTPVFIVGLIIDFATGSIWQYPASIIIPIST